MCYTCGCKLPFEDHSDPRNLTEKNLEEASKTEAAGEADIKKVKENIEDLIHLQKEAGELSSPKQSYAEEKS